MADDFGNNDPSDQDDAKGRGRGHSLRDVVRKALAQSLDARGVTEDTIRTILGDVKLPRELGNVVLQQADAIKSEVVRVVAGEVRNFLSEANLGEELAKILTSISFEVRTEIRFIPNDEALKPSVRSRVGVKSQRDEGEPELVATKESAVMDKAIRSSVGSLANRFLSRIDDLFEDELSEEDENDEEADAGAESSRPDEESSDVRSRGRKLRRPDLRRRAEAVASVGRATASRAAATAVTAARKPAASVASKAKGVASTASPRPTPKSTDAASRPQAVVRGQKKPATKRDEPVKAEADSESSARKAKDTAPSSEPKSTPAPTSNTAPTSKAATSKPVKDKPATTSEETPATRPATKKKEEGDA